MGGKRTLTNKPTCPGCGRILDEADIFQEQYRIGTAYLGCCKVSDGGCGAVIAFERKIAKGKYSNENTLGG